MPTLQTDSNVTDTQLVVASLAGQRDAFGMIVRRYQGIVTGVIYNRCRGDIARSEELAQDTFIAAWKSLASLEHTDRLGSWLCGIARTVANSASRDEQRRAVPTTPLVDLPMSSDGDPSEQAISREREELLWQSLEQIPEAYREPMILFYRQQQSAVEVAEALGLNETTVRKRLERGRAMLKQQVASVVEDLLTSTAPNVNFSMAVLAALPAASSVGVTKTVGGGTLLGAAGAKAVGVAFWLGPLIGVFGGLYGIAQSLRAARSARERRFVIQKGVLIFAIVALFMGLQFAISGLRQAMSGNAFVILTSVIWILFALTISFYAFYYSRWHEQIRREDGPEDGVSPSSKPSQIYLGVGLGLVGGMSWMLVLAANAGDWASFILLIVASVLLFRWSTRTVIRRGPRAVRGVMLKFFGVMLCMLVIVVNFRLRAWLVSGAGTAFGFPSGDAVPNFPLFATNLLVFAIGLAMILPILLTKGSGHPPSADNVDG